MRDRGLSAIDPVTLAEELGREKMLEETGGPPTCTTFWRPSRTLPTSAITPTSSTRNTFNGP